MIELKPCPFCGAEARYGPKEMFEFECGMATPSVFCTAGCGGNVIIPLMEEDAKGNSPHELRVLAAATWNRRAEG